MSDIAIKVDNISKRYRIGLKEEIHDSVGSALASWIKSPINNFIRLQKLSKFKDEDNEDIIWAVKDVSFEVKQGEVLGIIGKNGAGKSTLLKILSKITEPTSGRIEINGRVASLLEVGTGFHGELTGRENVYLNGTILGMTKKEVDNKFDEIVAFSGVEKFIDTPVKRYSSGMTVRLAFAVAAHLEPEILIIDEVLAVGDAEFQQKCLGKMKDVAVQGRTVLFVSHNMIAVKNLCNSCMLLEQGAKVKESISSEIINLYLNRNLDINNSVFENFDIYNVAEGIILKNSTVIINKVKLLNENYKRSNTFNSNEKIIIEIDLIAKINLKDLRISVNLVDEMNGALLSSISIDDKELRSFFYDIKKGNYLLQCIIPPNTLGENTFFVSVVVNHRKIEHYSLSKILSFNVIFNGYSTVEKGSEDNSYFRPKCEWLIVN